MNKVSGRGLPAETLALTPTGCQFHDCGRPLSAEFVSLAICDDHALTIVREYVDLSRSARLNSSKPPPQVYYLLVAPGVVKIGTTHYLLQRVRSLRRPLTDLMAAEPGGIALERKRHKQFADEREGKLENFRLTPRLREHVQRVAERGRPVLTEWSRFHKNRLGALDFTEFVG